MPYGQLLIDHGCFSCSSVTLAYLNLKHGHQSGVSGLLANYFTCQCGCCSADGDSVCSNVAFNPLHLLACIGID